MTTKSGRSIYIQAVKSIDLAIGWIEIRTVPSARADLVANKVELAWLRRYPLLNKVIKDRENEFLAKFKKKGKPNCLQESSSKHFMRKSAPNNW